jgi:hypothetical protein
MEREPWSHDAPRSSEFQLLFRRSEAWRQTHACLKEPNALSVEPGHPEAEKKGLEREAAHRGDAEREAPVTAGRSAAAAALRPASTPRSPTAPPRGLASAALLVVQAPSSLAQDHRHGSQWILTSVSQS